MLRSFERLFRLGCPDWRILTASSALVALDILAVEPVNALITDLQMPGMSGCELLERVRRLYPAVLRFVQSSHLPTSECELDELAIQAFSKPADVSEVIAALLCALGGNGPASGREQNSA